MSPVDKSSHTCIILIALERTVDRPAEPVGFLAEVDVRVHGAHAGGGVVA